MKKFYISIISAMIAMVVFMAIAAVIILNNRHELSDISPMAASIGHYDNMRYSTN